MRVFDARCVVCDEVLQHRAWSPWPGVRRTLKRIVRAALLTLLVAGVPTAVFLYRYAKQADVRPWKLGARIDALASEQPPDWQAVRVLSRQLVDLRPRSARGWYMLALSGRRLGYHPRLAIREAREALRLAPQMGEAHLFVAAELAGLGRYEEARTHVAQAMAWSMAPAATWRLAGELELARTRPDVESALANFEEARLRGYESVELDVRCALLRQRSVGVVAPERYPPELTVALQRAKAALAASDAADAPGGLYEWLAAELALAEGRPSEAERLVTLGLSVAAEEGPGVIVRARLLVTKGRLALARESDTDAAAALRAAIAASTDPEIVGGATEVLVSSGREGLAREVLASTPAAGDPRGTVRAARAERERRAGNLDLALQLARDAADAAPGSADRLVLLGDVLRDRGEIDGAAAAYERALGVDPDSLAAAIRLALLAVDAGSGDVQAAAAGAAARIRELQGVSRADPRLDAALGRALVLAGRAAEAVEPLERVVRAMPWSARAWLGLGAAWRAGGDAAGDLQSADCAAEAARLAPFDRDVVLAAARAATIVGDDDGAVLATSIYLERVPGDAAVLRRRAEARMRLDDWAGAAKDFEAARAAGDDGLVVRLQLADAYVRAVRDEDAWALVEAAPDEAQRRALELVLASHRTRRVPTGFVFSSAVAVAVRHARDGRPREALDVLRAAVARDRRDAAAVRALVFLLCGTDVPGTSPEARLREAQSAADGLGDAGGAGVAAVLRGCVRLATGNAADAVGALRAAADALRWDPGASFLLGEALFATGDDVGARAAYGRTIWLPGGLAAYGGPAAVRLLALAQRVSDPADVERLLREALRADPRLIAAAARLSDRLLARGAHREAAEVAERTLAAAERAASFGDPPRGDAAAAAIELRKRALAARMEIGDGDLVGRHLDALERAGATLQRPDTVRGLVALQRGRPEDAATRFRAALAADDGDRLAAVGLAEALVREGDVDAALAFVRLRIDARPGELPMARVVVRSLVRDGRTEAALRVTGELLARAPLDITAVRQRVWVLGLLGRPAAAAAAAREAAAAARAADDAAVRSRAGLFSALVAEALLQLSDRAEDALAAARGVSIDPAVSGAARLAARIVEAECLAELGRADEADAVVRGLMGGWERGRPVAADDRRIESRVRFVLGMIAVRRGRLAAAAEQFVRAVEIDPLHHAAANNAAWCIAQTNASSPAALDFARRATRAAPRAATYWDTRALCERGSGLWDEALRSWEQADRLLAAAAAPAAERADVMLRRAELLLDMDRRGDARNLAARILELGTETPAAERARTIARSR